MMRAFRDSEPRDNRLRSRSPGRIGSGQDLRQSAMTRRRLFALLSGLLAMPATTIRSAMGEPIGSSRIVVLDGWVLLEDDLRSLAKHVA